MNGTRILAELAFLVIAVGNYVVLPACGRVSVEIPAPVWLVFAGLLGLGYLIRGATPPPAGG